MWTGGFLGAASRSKNIPEAKTVIEEIAILRPAFLGTECLCQGP
jgi:hypothetical protein